MKKTTLLITLFMLLSVGTRAVADDMKAISDLTARIVPSVASQFVWEKLPASGGDRFELSSVGDKIVIAGNNANSMAAGLGHYLKYYCLTEVSWYACDPVVVPEQLPAVARPVKVEARVDTRFFLNYCTFGYTMPWWKWNDWERLIDYMALNGVNMPLAITGQESIWYKVWSELGLTDSEIRNYFTGPAHLPWHRMQNIDLWQGPLPLSWLDGQEELQKRIVARERELNMKPVLPAFAGHVPQELARVMPEAKITRLKAWSDFSDNYACSFLDPMDPAYTKIQRLYLDCQRELYGTDHIYGIDLFNELTPPSWEPSYLRRVSKQVYESLRVADRDAVWLQMGWLFYYKSADWTPERVKAYLTAFGQEHQLMLDYFCEAYEVWPITKSLFGTPFIWCYLGNFGGNSTLIGNLEDINQRVENALDKAGRNLVGIGSTLEGFDLNPFTYEYIFEKAWSCDTHKEVDSWVENLADQRVGVVDSHARKAWKTIIDGIYNNPSYGGSYLGHPYHRHPLIVTRPQPLVSIKWNANLVSDQQTLVAALDELLQVESESPSYRFDAVNLTRELMSNCFSLSLARYATAAENNNLNVMLREEQFMRGILADMDELLASNSTFMMGKWIADARAMGRTEDERHYYEQNARCLLTSWGEEGSRLNDYARRMWSGMLSSYYAERWSLYFGAVRNSVLSGEKFDAAAYARFKQQSARFETLWWQQCIGEFDDVPSGDELPLARQMFAKYRNTSTKQNQSESH